MSDTGCVIRHPMTRTRPHTSSLSRYCHVSFVQHGFSVYKFDLGEIDIDSRQNIFPAKTAIPAGGDIVGQEVTVFVQCIAPTVEDHERLNVLHIIIATVGLDVEYVVIRRSRREYLRDVDMACFLNKYAALISCLTAVLV